MEKLVTILTPTYNRENYLTNLYNSLRKQTNKQFVWLVVDDGSTDATEELISTLKKESDFDVEYVKKENGGKHTALNVGFDIVKTKYTFIVDSDDTVTEDAVESIYEHDSEVTENDLAGMSFLKGEDGKVIGTQFPDKGIFNGIDIQFRYKVMGDKAEVWRSDLLKGYKFPVFENEKFQGENYVWWQIALKYDMLYINKIIYCAEYLQGGLSLSGKNLRIRCPLGGMQNSKMAFNDKFPLRERIKRAWLFICYGFFAEKSIREIINESGRKSLIIPNLVFGYLLYIYWKIRYLK